MSVDDITHFATQKGNIAGFGLEYLVRVRDQIMPGSHRIVENVIKAVISISKKTLAHSEHARDDASSMDMNSDQNQESHGDQMQR